MYTNTNMNRFTIFHLLTLFCISFAPARADPEKYRALKEASIDDGKDLRKFNQDHLHLYKTVDAETKAEYYAIGNDSEKLCDDFSINQRNTIVTKDTMYIRLDLTTITLTFEGSPLAFFEDLYPLGVVRYTYAVHKASFGGEQLQDVSAIKVKKVEDDEWLLVAVNGSRKPCLIFPASFVKSTSIDDLFIVSLDIETKTKIMTTFKVEFKNGIAYNGFYSFMIERRLYG